MKQLSLIHISKPTIMFVLGSITLFGMLVNEWVGPKGIMLAMALWALYLSAQPQDLVATFEKAGILIWMVPVWATLSLLWSHHRPVSFRAGLELMLTAALAILVIRNLTGRQFQQAAQIVFGSIVMLSVVINHHITDGMTGQVNSAGVFGNKNTLSVTSALFVILCLSEATSAGQIWWRRSASGFGLLIGLAMMVRAHSVAVDLLMIVSIGLFIVLRYSTMITKRWRGAYYDIVTLLGVFGAGPISALILTYSAELLRMVGKNATLTGRTELWYWARQILKTNPFLGVGFRSFWVQGEAFPEMLWKIEHVEGRAGFHFHNLYYETAIELGPIGVLLSGLFIAAALWYSYRAMRLTDDAVGACCFAMIFFITSTQLQAVDLFSEFNCTFFIYICTFLVARRTVVLAKAQSRIPSTSPLRAYVGS